MAPSLTDYLHGLRRLWWIPVLSIVVGLGLGFFAASSARPTTQTRGNALFTFQIEDPGQDSAGSARGAEAEVAQARLKGYVELARTSPQVREILASHGTAEPPTTLSPTGTATNRAAVALIDVAETGIIEVRVSNLGLAQAKVDEVVAALIAEVVDQVQATDAQQVTPSLRPDPLITSPQPVEVPASRMSKLAVPVLLLAMLGFSLVYLLVWRQGRIYARQDVEGRVGARVLGDLSGRPADASAVVLALTKGRESGTLALIVPVPGTSPATAGLGDALAAAGQALGLGVSRTRTVESLTERAPVGGSAPPQAVGNVVPTDLALIEAPQGLDAHALLAAGSIDIVALAITYGRTTYRDLNVAGRTLADITDAEVAVIGVHPGRD